MASTTPTLEQVRDRWSNYAPLYTETSNKLMTLQCAREMNTHLQLDSASSVLEIASGAGIGSLDILQRMAQSKPHGDSKKSLLVTDLSPVMVDMARKTLASAAAAARDTIDVQIKEANGQDLSDVASGSISRVVSNLCLQLTPDPDAMLRETKRVLIADGIAGFTIWGRPEHCGKFTLGNAIKQEVRLPSGSDDRNFLLGQDLSALRAKFSAAGFSNVRIWSYQCVVELWSGEAFADFFCQQAIPADNKELYDRAFTVATRLANEFLTQGFPIGLETYIIIAKN